MATPKHNRTQARVLGYSAAAEGSTREQNPHLPELAELLALATAWYQGYRTYHVDNGKGIEVHDLTVEEIELLPIKPTTTTTKGRTK